MRIAIVFLIAAVVGLFIQARWVHSLFPSAIAPNFILILVVYLGLHFKNTVGVFGAFCLGILGDFATGQFIGPGASGAIVAFCLVVIVSEKIYAERGPAIVVLTFCCSIARSLMYLLMLILYVKMNIVTETVIKVILWEAFLCAAFAPFLIKLLAICRNQPLPVQSSRAEAYRWST